jgi:ribosomal protein L28
VAGGADAVAPSAGRAVTPAANSIAAPTGIAVRNHRRRFDPNIQSITALTSKKAGR